MKWNIEHRNLIKEESDRKVYATASVSIINESGVPVKIASVDEMTEYSQVSRTALMDAAYKLEQIAREMKSQAGRMR